MVAVARTAPENVRVLHALTPDQPQPVLGSKAPIAPQYAALTLVPAEQAVLLVAAQ